ncbi:MAG TPA: NAD(+) diphosphatase [Thermoanaerobaculia bacterium]|nr:NAD(+) diphosphatase [Thermoanaerobaculia bacterium]
MSTSPGHWFAFRGSELLVRVEDEAARLPWPDEISDRVSRGGDPHSIGTIEGATCWAVELEVAVEPPEGMAFHGLRRLWSLLPEEVWKLAGRAVQIVDWDRNHRFCGRCGTPTERKETERARVCPSCGLQQFPRLSPAVITLIEDGERVLLARSPHFVKGVYSTLAGFVEPGESLEEAVVREVREEVGVELTGLRYFSSQPWPFPNSLMVGFVATWAGGEIRPQEGEIEDARWFTPDDLPLLPPYISIARRLIDDFLERHGGVRGETARW